VLCICHFYPLSISVAILSYHLLSYASSFYLLKFRLLSYPFRLLPFSLLPTVSFRLLSSLLFYFYLLSYAYVCCSTISPVILLSWYPLLRFACCHASHSGLLSYGLIPSTYRFLCYPFSPAVLYFSFQSVILCLHLLVLLASPCCLMLHASHSTYCSTVSPSSLAALYFTWCPFPLISSISFHLLSFSSLSSASFRLLFYRFPRYLLLYSIIPSDFYTFLFSFLAPPPLTLPTNAPQSCFLEKIAQNSRKSPRGTLEASDK
jgi:hypothetical protein